MLISYEIQDKLCPPICKSQNIPTLLKLGKDFGH